MSEDDRDLAPIPSAQEDHEVDAAAATATATALAKSVLDWWSEAQFMVSGGGPDERNVFDMFDPPSFVTTARGILAAEGLTDPSAPQP